MQALRNSAGKKSIITKSSAGNEGKIVTCIRLATIEELIREWFNLHRGPVWWVDSYLPCNDGTFCNLVVDDRMTPLQDLDEPEPQVQELYTPSSSKVLDEVN